MEEDATLPGRAGEKKEAAEEVGSSGRSPGFLLTRELVWMVEEVGPAPSTSRDEENHVRLTTGGKTPTKNF